MRETAIASFEFVSLCRQPRSKKIKFTSVSGNLRKVPFDPSVRGPSREVTAGRSLWPTPNSRNRRLAPCAKVNYSWKRKGLMSAFLTNTVPWLAPDDSQFSEKQNSCRPCENSDSSRHFKFPSNFDHCDRPGAGRSQKLFLREHVFKPNAALQYECSIR